LGFLQASNTAFIDCRSRPGALPERTQGERHDFIEPHPLRGHPGRWHHLWHGAGRRTGRTHQGRQPYRPDLNSSAGIATLYQRIERAAADICQLPQGSKLLTTQSEIRNCRANAVDRAILQANLPALSSLHVARTGRNVDNSQYADRH